MGAGGGAGGHSRTMKHMKYFIRAEHFDAIGKLMLIISMAWAYFFFNDYMIQWYGGDNGRSAASLP
jgi:hypothetical protein